jgi:hypothetical protein
VGGNLSGSRRLGVPAEYSAILPNPDLYGNDIGFPVLTHAIIDRIAAGPQVM